MSNATASAIYRIETPRLILRCWTLTDAAPLKAAIDESLTHLRPWLPWALDEPMSLEEKGQLLRRFRSQFDRGEDFIYGIFNRGSGAVLGGTGLHTGLGKGAREIGYWLHVDQVGQGLMTEAVSALIRVGFEYEGLDRVEIHCDPRNVVSAGIPRRLGFRHEATLRHRTIEGTGARRDVMVWTLFAEEHSTSPASRLPITPLDMFGRQVAVTPHRDGGAAKV